MLVGSGDNLGGGKAPEHVTKRLDNVSIYKTNILLISQAQTKAQDSRVMKKKRCLPIASSARLVPDVW